MIGLYQFIARFLTPYVFKNRLKKGKLNLDRQGEYQGFYEQSRPKGRLFWIHGASVGEGLSCIVLLDTLQKKYPDWNFLLTTGTKLSAEFLQDNLPERTIHGFAPFDNPDWVNNFYQHWRPDLVCFLESEFWPLRCFTADRLGIPRILFNGRMSHKSFKRYQLLPVMIRKILVGFEKIAVQDVQQLKYFHSLGAVHAEIKSNLKDTAEPLADDPELRQEWQNIIADRPFWLATSTHEGEEEIIIEAHQKLLQKFPTSICLIAPRHSDRCNEIKDYITQNIDFQAEIGASRKANCSMYLIDQFGILGVLYRLTGRAFIGGSLVARGGHNLREACLLGCLPICGPNLGNFMKQKEDYSPKIVHNANDLANEIMHYWQSPSDFDAQIAIVQKTALERGKDALADSLKLLAPYFEGEKGKC